MRLRYTTLAVVAALLGAASADRPAPRSALQQRRRLDGLNAPQPVNEGRAAVRRLQGGAGSPKLLRQLKIPLAFTCWARGSLTPWSESAGLDAESGITRAEPTARQAAKRRRGVNK